MQPANRTKSKVITDSDAAMTNRTFPVSMRNFLRISGASVVALAAPYRHALASANAAPMSELTYADVDLQPSDIARQASENHRFLLSLDENGMLFPFRKRAGLAAPGEDLGGWYGTDAFAPGATFGQWMAGLARYAAITNDEATKEKVSRLVREYALTIGDGFYRNNRFPSYTYDKLTLGLMDARRLASSSDAMSALRRTTTTAQPFLPPHAMPRMEHDHPPEEDFTHHVLDESYTIPENQFLAWRLTGDRTHRKLAQQFLYDDFFFALARGENALPGKHAYSHVNALSSAAQAYLSLGDRRYLDAARRGFEFVHAQSFATGGWGPDEHFVQPGSGKLGASLDAEHKSFETPCGAYAHFKLTRYLMRITRDARYGDSMERVMYNTVLGAKPIQADGRAFYYSDYTRDARKGFHPDHWPCCSGTLPLVAADYRISLCFTDDAGIYVNLYVPATVRWRQGNSSCEIKVATDYPYDSAVSMSLKLPSPQTFTVNLRIPAWANGASVKVNGVRSPVSIEPGSFAKIRREWRNDDRIELELPLTMQLRSVDAEHPDFVALSAGPLVLMRVTDDANAPKLTRAELMSAKRIDGAREWQIRRDRGDVRLRAFPDIRDESYSTYQQVWSA